MGLHDLMSPILRCLDQRSLHSVYRYRTDHGYLIGEGRGHGGSLVCRLVIHVTLTMVLIHLIVGEGDGGRDVRGDLVRGEGRKGGG